MAYSEDIRNRPVTGHDYSDVPAGTDTIENERDDSASTAIEREIDRTRREMDQTVEVLAERLRPSSLVGDLLDYFGSDEGTRMNTPKKEKVKRVAKRAGRGAWDTVRDHPLPSLAAAGAIAWLLMRRDHDDEDGYRTSRYRRYRGEMEAYGPEYGEVFDDEGEYEMDYETGRRRGMTRRMRNYASTAARRAKEAMRSAGHSVSETASHLGERAKEAAHSAGESLSSGMHSAREGAGQWTRSARHRTGQWTRSAGDMGQRGYRYSRDRFEEGLEEYPLAMAAGALALGVMAGVLIPRTRLEDRSIGEYSHEAKMRAKRLAREAMHRGRAAAEEEGLSPRSMKDQAKDLAGRVRESAGRVAGAAVEAAKDVGRRVKEEARSEARELRDEAEDRGLTPGAIKEKARHVAQEAASGARGEQREDENMPAGVTAFGHVPVGEESQHQGTRPGAPPMGT